MEDILNSNCNRILNVIVRASLFKIIICISIDLCGISVKRLKLSIDNLGLIVTEKKRLEYQILDEVNDCSPFFLI